MRIHGEESTIRTAHLVIDAYGLATLTTAERDYVSRVEFELPSGRRSPWSRDGSPADLGDRSDALARTVIIEGGADRLRSEYQIFVLHGNLVVNVELSVYDEAEVAKETLAGIAHGLTAETIARVPLVPVN